MHRNGHIGAALLVGSPLYASVVSVFGVPPGIFVSVLLVAGGLFPDRSEDFLPVSHRGVTHTFLFCLFSGAVAGGAIGGLALEVVEQSMAAQAGSLATVAFTLGGLSHLFADSLTVGRGDFAIRPYWPVSRKTFRVGIVRSDSVVANYLFLVTGTIAWLAVFSISLPL